MGGGVLVSFCSLLPHRGGRWKVNLFTTSAPGSGDELRLALCLPRAGPGLSHGGQMTTEAKWVLSCSPQQPLHTPPFQSSQAPLGQREGGWRGYKVQAITGSSSGQRIAGPSTLLICLQQAHSPSKDCSQPLQGKPSLSQYHPRMPQNSCSYRPQAHF